MLLPLHSACVRYSQKDRDTDTDRDQEREKHKGRQIKDAKTDDSRSLYVFVFLSSNCAQALAVKANVWLFQSV